MLGALILTLIVCAAVGFHKMAHSGLVRFGAQLYAVDSDGCAFAYALGQCLDVIYPEYQPPAVPTTTTTTTQAPSGEYFAY